MRLGSSLLTHCNTNTLRRNVELTTEESIELLVRGLLIAKQSDRQHGKPFEAVAVSLAVEDVEIPLRVRSLDVAERTLRLNCAVK